MPEQTIEIDINRGGEFQTTNNGTELEITNRYVMSPFILPPGIFDNLTNLKSLYFTNVMHLESLPDGIFDKLVNLEKLMIYHTSLKSLPSGVFDKLINLRELSVSYIRDGNSILSDIPKLVNLQRLSMSNINFGITELPNGLFDNLVNLQELNINSNGLTAILRGSFDKLVNLQRLDISGNEIQYISGNLFNNLVNLQSLEMDRNKLQLILEKSFDSLTKLKILRIGRNNLKVLPPKLFDLLVDLEKLDISGNNLSALRGKIFNKLAKLRELHINGNELKELPDGIFNKLAKLQMLYLNNNNLKSLPKGVFDKLVKLQRLYISGNELKELPNGIFNKLTKLQVLYLDDNNLNPLPKGIFDNLVNLQRFYLPTNYTDDASKFENTPMNVIQLFPASLKQQIELYRKQKSKLKKAMDKKKRFDLENPLVTEWMNICQGTDEDKEKLLRFIREKGYATDVIERLRRLTFRQICGSLSTLFTERVNSFNETKKELSNRWKSKQAKLKEEGESYFEDYENVGVESGWQRGCEMNYNSDDEVAYDLTMTQLSYYDPNIYTFNDENYDIIYCFSAPEVEDMLKRGENPYNRYKFTPVELQHMRNWLRSINIDRLTQKQMEVTHNPVAMITNIVSRPTFENSTLSVDKIMNTPSDKLKELPMDMLQVNPGMYINRTLLNELNVQIERDQVLIAFAKLIEDMIQHYEGLGEDGVPGMQNIGQYLAM